MLDTELDALPELIADAAEPLPEIDDPAFGAMFDRFGEARVVLLGEASHGTSEFYRARAAIACSRSAPARAMRPRSSAESRTR